GLRRLVDDANLDPELGEPERQDQSRGAGTDDQNVAAHHLVLSSSTFEYRIFGAAVDHLRYTPLCAVVVEGATVRPSSHGDHHHAYRRHHPPRLRYWLLLLAAVHAGDVRAPLLRGTDRWPRRFSQGRRRDRRAHCRHPRRRR